jgi:hypothetical protein
MMHRRTIRRRDHGRSRRHKRHLHDYWFPESKEEREQWAVNHGAYGDVTLGDQDDAAIATHDDTRNAWHRVWDALGTLLVLLHIAHRNDDTII